MTAVQESKKAGITKKDKNYSGSRKRHSKKAAKPGENPHQGNNSGPKAKSLPNTSSQPRSLPAIVPVELPVQTSKGSLGSETQAQARKPRKLQPVREEEVTLRASQDATIKAILAASVGAASGIAVHTNTNTIQAVSHSRFLEPSSLTFSSLLNHVTLTLVFSFSSTILALSSISVAVGSSFPDRSDH